MIEPGTMRMSEAVESLTGFETIAVEDHFGKPWEELSGTRLTLGVIAMLHKRDGMSARDAWQAAKGMTVGQINAFFADEPHAELDGEPSDEPGKD